MNIPPRYDSFIAKCWERGNLYSGNLRTRFSDSYYKVWSKKYLEKSQWLNQEDILELQNTGLKQLIKHAKTNTKYYQGLENIRDIDDLSSLPLLTKKDIKDNNQSLRSSKNPGYQVHTSGTVSKSTTIKDWRLRYDFGYTRFHSWIPGTKNRQCELWGSASLDTRPLIKDNYLYLPAGALKTRKDAVEYLEILCKFKPDFLRAFVSPLRFLSHYAIEESINVECSTIQTAGETLTNDARETIEAAFNCQVYNYYTSRELGAMAHDCEHHQGLHINSERYIVEEVDGRLLFTDLLNYSMPLIRYENQDTGRLLKDHCSCGRGLPMIDSVIGRTQDYLLSKQGTWLFWSHINHFIKVGDLFRWAEAWQFIQDEPGHVRILFKPWGPEQVIDLNKIKTTLQTRIPSDEMDIEIEIAENLLTNNGKARKVITYTTPWD